MVKRNVTWARTCTEKGRAAEIFYEKWRTVAEDEGYLVLEEEHRRCNP